MARCTLKLVREGRWPAIITIDGLLSEHHDSVDDWASTLPSCWSGHAWYHLDWPAASRKQLSRILRAVAIGSTAVRSMWRRVRYPFALKAVLAALGLTAAGLLALFKRVERHARRTGRELAEDLLTQPPFAPAHEASVVLVGHSLGGQVVASALDHAGSETARIAEVHLLGAAVCARSSRWATRAGAVHGQLFNYYSRGDWMLRWLFHPVAHPLSRPPAGVRSLGPSDGISDTDVSDSVGGHLAWKQSALAERLAEHTSVGHASASGPDQSPPTDTVLTRCH